MADPDGDRDDEQDRKKGKDRSDVEVRSDGDHQHRVGHCTGGLTRVRQQTPRRVTNRGSAMRSASAMQRLACHMSAAEAGEVTVLAD